MTDFAYAFNMLPAPDKPGSRPSGLPATRYTNYPFLRIVRYRDNYYGINATGMYRLTGLNDAGEATSFKIKTAMTDFGAATKKTLAAAYVGGRFGPTATIEVHAGETNPATYSYTTPRSADAQSYRQAFGKGMKARYYALGIYGSGVCQLDSISLDIHNLARRI